MKYFITDTGLVPFDLTPTELTNILLGDAQHNQIKPTNDETNFDLSVNAITQLMDKPCCLFKHPDMTMDILIEIIRYIKHYTFMEITIVDEYYLIEKLYEQLNQISIVTSINPCKNLKYHHTIESLPVDAPIVKTWERKLIIDSILKDLSL